MTTSERPATSGTRPAREDTAIATTEEAEKARGGENSAAASRFDIRRIIGGLFVLYGVVLFVAGLVDGEAAKEKAAGIEINIWAGLGMLLFGISFLVWMKLNPVEPARETRSEQEPERASAMARR
jgi:hypothetical protein